MKKIFLVALCSIFICLNCFATIDKKSVQIQKPKIVVLMSKGGSGHISACDVLKNALPNYELVLFNPIYDYFHKAFDGENWYNNCFQSGWTSTINFFVRYPAPLFFDFTSRSFQKRFIQTIQQEKTVMLISVMPFINYPAAKAARICKVPFLIITLDADLKNWLISMKKCHNHNFTMTVQAKTPRIKKQLKRKHIPESCIKEVGSPLRKDFFTPKDKPAIRKEWNIPEGKEVVLLMRGGTGSTKLVDYTKELLRLDRKLHLLVCIGRNQKLAKKFDKIKPTKFVTFTVVPFTPKIPDLMAVSDLLISQPSPNTCNEAMHMKLPILVDMTTTCLFWERATTDWIDQRGSGATFKRMSQLNKMVIQCLDEKKKGTDKKFKPAPNFDTEIRKIIAGMLKKK